MRVNEIFTGLSGEADGFNNQGGLATFIRLQGCNLDCKWCDTKQALHNAGGEELSVKIVASLCAKSSSKHIIITGGEPLLQLPEVKLLVDKLIKRKRLITIETNGSTTILIDPARTEYNQLRFVVDYKLGSSGMTEFMEPSAFDRLYSHDVIKFVMADLMDYRQAKKLIHGHPKWRAVKVFSPAMPKQFVGSSTWPATLAQQIVKDKLEGVQLSLQLHKLLSIR